MLTYAKETIRHKAEAHTLGMERFIGTFLIFPVMAEKNTTLREWRGRGDLPAVATVNTKNRTLESPCCQLNIYTRHARNIPQ